MQEAFFELAEGLFRGLRAGERLLLWLSGERSDFVRFNRGKVRQAGSVEQRSLTLRLVRGARHASTSFDLGGDGDSSLCEDRLLELRAVLEDVPEDPWLLLSDEPRSTESVRRGEIPEADRVVEEVVRAAAGRDFVGIYAGGMIARGLADSAGGRHWHEVDSFNLDFSLYRQGDLAAKSGYAGFQWNEADFRARLEAAAADLEKLGLPRETISPGEYRVYFAPQAMAEIMGLLQWGAFSARARATRQSPLLKLEHGERWSHMFTLAENTAEGVAPGFQPEGFVRPARVSLVREGRLEDALASPRTAREYGVPNTAADGAESPESLDLAPGALPAAQALEALGDGLWLNNLWYLNYSDRPSGRITGMTRFAAFRVAGGRIVAPIGPMRFDDSLHRMFGPALEALTRERELLLDPASYGERSVSSARLPGALLSAFRFTL